MGLCFSLESALKVPQPRSKSVEKHAHQNEARRYRERHAFEYVGHQTIDSLTTGEAFLSKRKR
jgi:hypothetical protein